jgi:arginine decarboxylase
VRTADRRLRAAYSKLSWERVMPNKTAHVDQFLLVHSGRADDWREITTLADAWAANRGERAALEAAIAAVAPAEEYHAYPGGRLLSALSERIATNDAGGAAKLARRISNGLLTHSYRFDAPNWSVRVSFANLPDDAYDDIGRGVRAVGRGYVDTFNALKGK